MKPSANEWLVETKEKNRCNETKVAISQGCRR